VAFSNKVIEVMLEVNRRFPLRFAVKSLPRARIENEPHQIIAQMDQVKSTLEGFVPLRRQINGRAGGCDEDPALSWPSSK
jgi:hypothetical protein